MHMAHTLLQLLYLVCIIGLSLYGFQAFWLTGKYLHHARTSRPTAPTHWPHVTVQLPIYNERHVVERLVAACVALDYPRDRLQIQLLDDSDDSTAALTEHLAQSWQRAGVNISVVRRTDRRGYKAGALAHALPLATGEFIAIFDADFVPAPNFLKSTLPHFFQSCNAQEKHSGALALRRGRTLHQPLSTVGGASFLPHPEGDGEGAHRLPGLENTAATPTTHADASQSFARVGFVQTRWDHLNRGYSWLTDAQALALDGHFVVEQTGRAAASYPFGFNGTAGVWRRACIEDPAVGGWQDDTLCEDLDLSYRAQLAGWRGVYLSDVSVPAELPAQLLAFKRQQFRWAKGSVQTLRKLAPRIPSAPWSLAARCAAAGHLGNYLIHPLLLTMLLLSLPMTLLGVDPAAPLAALSLFSFGPPLLYAVAQRRLAPAHWLRRFVYLPLLMLLGTGLCLNNSIAVAQALLGRGGPFLRTPKFDLQLPADRWQLSAYRLPLPRLVLGEAALALYAVLCVAAAALMHHWAAVPFLSIYVAGFALMVAVQVNQAWQARRAVRRYHPPLGLEARAEQLHNRVRT